MKKAVTIAMLLALCVGLAPQAQADVPELTHYLVLGFDFWGDERIGVSYSDTNILATIDKANGRLMVTSLMRDTYVEKPDGTWGRLNNIVRDEGFDVMLETVSHNYGVEVDRYIAIGVKGLRRIIDQLGGVEITVTRAEAEKLGDVSGIHGAGTYTVGSAGAMAYIRLRKMAGHDFGRTERQRKVLASVYTQVRTMPMTDMLGLAQLLFEEVETNLTLQDLLEAVSLVAVLEDAELEMMRLPVDDSYENVTRHGMAVYELDWEKNREALYAFLGLE